MSNEIELKFEINNADITALQHYLNQWAHSDELEFAAISQQKRTFSQLTLCNTYYDTADYYLRHHGCGLRVRASNDSTTTHFEITLKRDKKTIAGLHERAEFNVDLLNSEPDLAVLPYSALPDNCDIERLQQDLLPLFSTDFKRQVWLISFASSEIEVALDQGKINSNGKNKIIQEVELELKQGNKQDLLNFALELSRFHLHLFSQSKAARGYFLLENSLHKICQFDLQIHQDLAQLLKFWQQNEEYALEVNNLDLYQQTLNQINYILIDKNLSLEPEFTQWQMAIMTINSVEQFAFSEINTRLKLMLIANLTVN
ncbi:CYTH domain-containing protein [Gilliamella mensalis]|uniref:CYTH domain-containing protein n=1 Tax=Gilliamella mensalis TaxID=1908520 RepID=UPI000A15C990|nr:CYTH domain-containing protein [Gilliamella mensalis]